MVKIIVNNYAHMVRNMQTFSRGEIVSALSQIVALIWFSLVFMSKKKN